MGVFVALIFRALQEYAARLTRANRAPSPPEELMRDAVAGDTEFTGWAAEVCANEPNNRTKSCAI